MAVYEEASSADDFQSTYQPILFLSWESVLHVTAIASRTNIPRVSFVFSIMRTSEATEHATAIHRRTLFKKW
jgi:hypothetical protein